MSLSYEYRQHAFLPLTTYRLEPDALTWTSEKGQGRIPYRKIDEFNLSYEPTNWASRRYRTRIKGNDLKVDLINLNYRGIADFEPLNAEYRSFISELIERVSQYAPQTPIQGGNTLFAYRMYQLIALLAAIVLIGVAVLFYTMDMPEFIALKLLLIAVYLPVLKRYLERNRPQILDPGAIPSYLLPNEA